MTTNDIQRKLNRDEEKFIKEVGTNTIDKVKKLISKTKSTKHAEKIDAELKKLEEVTPKDPKDIKFKVDTSSKEPKVIILNEKELRAHTFLPNSVVNLGILTENVLNNNSIKNYNILIYLFNETHKKRYILGIIKDYNKEEALLKVTINGGKNTDPLIEGKYLLGIEIYGPDRKKLLDSKKNEVRIIIPFKIDFSKKDLNNTSSTVKKEELFLKVNKLELKGEDEIFFEIESNIPAPFDLRLSTGFKGRTDLGRFEVKNKYDTKINGSIKIEKKVGVAIDEVYFMAYQKGTYNEITGTIKKR